MIITWTSTINSIISPSQWGLVYPDSTPSYPYKTGSSGYNTKLQLVVRVQF